MSRPRVATLRLETPEHVELGFVLADPGERLNALLIDLGILLAGLIALLLPLYFLLGRGSVFAALVLLAIFVLRNFYFTAGEVLGHGRTPGKRFRGLRVIARDGGPLAVEQVIARNLTRELELFLPLTMAFAPEMVLPQAPPWARVSTLAWVALLAALPLISRQRLRLGDLVAGTVVVEEPRVELAEDLVEVDPLRRPEELEAYVFSREQLAIYGIRELQVLETVLRRPPSEERDALMARISDRIQAKIGWEGEAVDVPLFLQAFYAAQRGTLERGLLFGERRERKVR